MTTPPQILRATLVSLLEDMLREAERLIDSTYGVATRVYTSHEAREIYLKSHEDARALRRVIAMVRVEPIAKP